MDDLTDDGLASSFLLVVVVVLLMVVSAFFVIVFLSGVDEMEVILLDVVDRVETGSAALRPETGVVGLLDDTTGRLIPVLTSSDWISFSSCKNSVTESSAGGDSTGFFGIFWTEMGVLVRRGMLLLDLMGDVAGDDLVLDLVVVDVELVEEL